MSFAAGTHAPVALSQVSHGSGQGGSQTHVPQSTSWLLTVAHFPAQVVVFGSGTQGAGWSSPFCVFVCLPFCFPLRLRFSPPGLCRRLRRRRRPALATSLWASGTSAVARGNAPSSASSRRRVPAEAKAQVRRSTVDGSIRMHALRTLAAHERWDCHAEGAPADRKLSLARLRHSAGTDPVPPYYGPHRSGSHLSKVILLRGSKGKARGRRVAMPVMACVRRVTPSATSPAWPVPPAR